MTRMTELRIHLETPKEVNLFYEVLRGYAFHVQHVSEHTQGVDRGVDLYHKKSWAMAEKIMQYIEKEQEYVEIHRPTFPRERELGDVLATEHTQCGAKDTLSGEDRRAVNKLLGSET